MNPARWRQIESLYDRAVEMDVSGRKSFLREACGSDDELFHEVEELLADGSQSASFLEKPALQEFAIKLGTRFPSWIGRHVGNYEFLSLAGAGGMGEVYWARDTKLQRDVAIKILPDEFSSDADRVSRFQREAQLLASLNHPNIAAIYDIEEVGGQLLLILESVQGETLAERLKRAPIALPDVLKFAVQIAEGLEAAHERGIIHRDLKPANIKLTPDDKVKLLDFGLARVSTGLAADYSTSVTNSEPIPGSILGTAAYMSPEQASGILVDRRTDIFAFGAVLYEMLTGERAFPGETSSESLAAAIQSEPDWTKLPAVTPQGVRRVLRRCLQKDRNRRWQTAGDARIELVEIQEEPEDDFRRVVNPLRRERPLWIFALVLLALVTVSIIFWSRPRTATTAEFRSNIAPPAATGDGFDISGRTGASLAASPDGLKVVFKSLLEGDSRLWLHSTDTNSDRPLLSTEGANYPFWAPNSRSVGFFAGGKLKIIGIDDGTAQELADARGGRGGTWNRDGVILFAPNGTGHIMRVSTASGVPTPATRVQEPAGGNFPVFLSDGRRFVYFIRGSANRIYISELDGSESTPLVDADGSAAIASNGQLLFVRHGKLFAQNLDPVQARLTGEPVLVAESVAVDDYYASALSASAAGLIVYRASPQNREVQFAWFNRKGTKVATLGLPDSASLLHPEISRNRKHVAMSRKKGNWDVWLLETARGTPRLFTSSPALEMHPIFSPDGSRVVFDSARNGVSDLYWKSMETGGKEELLLTTPQGKMPLDFSHDGKLLIYQTYNSKTRTDLMALPLDPPGKPFAVVQTEFDDRVGEISPDGKWIAYSSDELGQSEIYVQAFPRATRRQQLSIGGGGQVRWSTDGKELFFISRERYLMAVPMRVTPDGLVFNSETPAPLFLWPGNLPGMNEPRQQYVVDGERFLISTQTREGRTSPITAIVNRSPSR